MVVRRIAVAAELQHALELLARVWVLALPPALASLAGMVAVVVAIGSLVVGLGGASVLVAGGWQALGAALGLGALTMLALVPLAMLLLFVANAVTIVAAEDAWAGRAPDFGRALGVVVRKLPALVVAGLAIFALSIVPALLTVVGIGFVLLLALGFATMYVLPAILLGNEGGLGALTTSYRLVRADLGTNALAYAAMVVVGLAGPLANTLVVHVPLVNFLASFLIGGFTAAYAALVAARFYALQRAQATAV